MKFQVLLSERGPFVSILMEGKDDPHTMWGEIRKEYARTKGLKPEEAQPEGVVFGCPHRVGIKFSNPDDVPLKDLQFPCQGGTCYVIKYPKGEAEL